MNPAPPTAILERMDDRTRGLFLDHHADLLDAALDAHQASPLDAHHVVPQVKANGRWLMANGSGLRELFADFWKKYPRRVGKGAAWKAWQKLHPSADVVGTMLAALEWQRKQDDWLRDGGRFVPHPATWLNQTRWEDEPSLTPRIAPVTLNAARGAEEFLKS